MENKHHHPPLCLSACRRTTRRWHDTVAVGSSLVSPSLSSLPQYVFS